MRIAISTENGLVSFEMETEDVVVMGCATTWPTISDIAVAFQSATNLWEDEEANSLWATFKEEAQIALPIC